MKCYAVLYKHSNTGKISLSCWGGWTSNTDPTQEDLAVDFDREELINKHEFLRKKRDDENFFIHEFDVEIP